MIRGRTAPIQSRDDIADLYSRVAPDYADKGPPYFAFSRGQDPGWTWYDELLRGTGAQAELPRPLGYAGIRDPGVLQGLLEAAGLTETVEHVELTDMWYASPEAWWTSLWTHGSRRPLERMPADVLADFQKMAMARVRAMAEAPGALEQMHLVYVTGRRA